MIGEEIMPAVKFRELIERGLAEGYGQMGYEDYTKHHNKSRRKNYLTRTKGMLGDWKNNKYSANNLSRHILW